MKTLSRWIRKLDQSVKFFLFWIFSDRMKKFPSPPFSLPLGLSFARIVVFHKTIYNLEFIIYDENIVIYFRFDVNYNYMAKFLLHSLFLLSAVVLAFFWTSNPQLSYYTLQLVALFVVFFFINQFIARHHRHKLNLTIDAVVFTMIVLLLVCSSGGLSSPLFFLIYFLMFGLALLFEPLITISLALAMILFFLFTPTKVEPLQEALQLFSLLLITPVATFFGRQYLKVLEDEEKIKILEEEEKIMEEEIAKEETDVLLWTTLELKRGLTEILDQASQMLADVGHLTISQKERLMKIREWAARLLKSGKKLKEEVDTTTDES